MPSAAAPLIVAIATTWSAVTAPAPCSARLGIGGEAHRQERVEVVRRGCAVGAERDGDAGGVQIGDAGEPTGQLEVRGRAMGDRRAGLGDQRRCRRRSAWTPWASTRARAEQPGVAQHLDRSAAVVSRRRPAPTRRSSRRRGRGRRAPSFGDEVADGTQLVFGQQVRAVRTHEAIDRRGVAGAVRGPSACVVERPAGRRRGTRRTPDRSAGGSRSTSATAAGRLREEVHVEGGRDAGAQALGDGEGGADRPPTAPTARLPRRASVGRGNRRGRGRRRGRGTSSSRGGCGR